MGGGRRSSSSSDTDSSDSHTKKDKSRSKRRHKRRSRSRSSDAKRSSSDDSVSILRAKTSKKSSRRKDRRGSSRESKSSSRRRASKSRSASTERRRPRSRSPSTKKSRRRRSTSKSTSQSQRSRKSRSPSIEGNIVGSESKMQKSVGKTSQDVQKTVFEQMDRAQAIEEINASGFEPKDFKSGRSIATAVNLQNRQIDDHDIVIFGTNAEAKSIVGTTVTTSGPPPVNSIASIKGQIAHENLYGDQAAKQERWIRRLHNMRQKKLNGEAMA